MINMSHVRCAFCGKDCAFSTFKPEEMDLDIYVRQVHSLGNKGGFTYGPDESVFGDDYFTPKFLNRCFALINRAKDDKILTDKECATRLNIGVPIQGTNRIIPYENALQTLQEINVALRKKNQSLEFQVSLRRSDASRSQYEELKTRHDSLLKKLEVKNKIEKILKFLYNNSDSKIIWDKDDWILEVYDYDPFIFVDLCKQIFALEKPERDILRKRIKSELYDFQFIFHLFRFEPTIKSLSDFMIKPSWFYSKLLKLQNPNFVNIWEPGIHRKEDWETFS